MEDVNNPSATPNTEETNSTPTQGKEPLQAEAAPESQSSEPQERTVPLSALRRERQKYQQKLRELQSRNQPTYSPDSPESKDAYVRTLEGQVAESQLEKRARSVVKEYPELPKAIKNAILRNPLGFCKPGTKDVDGGEDDIRDYVEDYLEEFAPEPAQPKSVQVAGGNTPAATQPGATPAQIQAILNKDVNSWTKEEIKMVDDYKESLT
jgi:hypothetical protein